MGLLTSTYIAQNELTRAEALLDEFAPPSVPAVTLGQRQMWMSRIELALAQHAPDRALAALNHMLKPTANATPQRVVPRLWLLHALMLLQMDRAQQAEDVAQAALADLQEIPQARLLWRAHGVLGKIYRAQGRAQEAAQAAQAAQDLVASMAATLNDASMRENFVRRADEWIEGN